MVVERMQVGIVVERQAIRHAWADHRWKAVSVLPGAPAAAPWTVLAEAPEATRYLAGTAEMALYSGETVGLKAAIEQETPSVWVVLRRSADSPTGWTLLLATVDAGEAQAHADTGDDLVEAVPMPAPIRDRVAAFVAQHHVEQERWKRKRDRADPEAMAFGRTRGTRPEDDDD